MKKLTVILMALIMVFSMAACGGSDASGNGDVINVTIDIDYPDASGIADVEDFQMQVAEGTNALEMLQQYGEENEVEIVMAESSPTAYVTAINGVAETADAGWVYEINDEMTMDAADKCILEEGMGITWEYMTWGDL